MQNIQIKRNEDIDVVKGIAIILMVVGHTFMPGRNFIYLFHMAVFIIASGFCSKLKFSDFYELKEYWKKKVICLYFPYIICNEAYLLLSNVFLKLNVYSDKSIFLRMTEDDLYPQELIHHISYGEMIKRGLKILLLLDGTKLGGATWFLYSLFIVLTVYSTIAFVFKRYWKDEKIYITNIVVLIALTVLIFLLNYIFPDRMSVLKRMVAMLMAFSLGQILQYIPMSIYKPVSAIISLLVLLLLKEINPIDIGMGRVGNPVIYMILSVAGWILLMSISMTLKSWKKIKRKMMYIGKQTMWVICLHFFAFKIVSLFYLWVKREPIYLLASFPVIFSSDILWRILYAVVGVLVPIAVEKYVSTTWRNLSGKLCSRKHKC